MDEYQQRLAESLGRARDFLLTSIEGLDERTATSVPVLGDWTAKDIIAHLVSWGDELRSEISEILIDPAPKYSYVISGDRDYDEWNRGRVAEAKSLSLPEIVAELDRDYEETADLLRRLAPDELQRRGVVPWKIMQLPPPEEVTPETSASVAAVLETHIQHIEEHAEEIGRWRRQREQSVEQRR
jgi:hypothetical protein